MAAVMNFVGAFLGQKVAQTVSEVISPPNGTHGLIIVMAGLLGAIAWNMITWYFGLPSSSSHALIGGLAGSAMAAGVTVHWDKIVDKVVIPMRSEERRVGKECVSQGSSRWLPSH